MLSSAGKQSEEHLISIIQSLSSKTHWIVSTGVAHANTVESLRPLEADRSSKREKTKVIEIVALYVHIN